MYALIWDDHIATGFTLLSTALLCAEDWAKRGYRVTVVEGEL